MKKHRLWPSCVLLLIALAVVGFAEGSLLAIPEHLQFIWQAPAQIEPTTSAESETTETPKPVNSGMREARSTMETVRAALEGACDAETLYAVAEGASVSVKDGDTAIARMEAIEADAYALKPINLYTGRLIYPEEFEYGEHVVMVDEQLAVALFKYAEPVDREILLGEDTYRIVGVIRDGKSVGDKQEYTFYVPYRAIEKSSVSVDALCIEARPIEGAGGWAAFESATATIDAKGTTINLNKECRNAALPLRTLGCVAGFMVILWLIRLLNQRASAFYREYKRRLIDQYAVRLFPWMLGRSLLLGLGYIACTAAFAGLFTVFVAPVYTFPEWVPAVLVEPTDIQKAFWNVWQKQASLMELRSPELIRARFFRELMAWGCGACALFGGMIAVKLRAALREKAKPVEPDDSPAA